MKLIELYVQEVTIRLPEKLREDIGLELRSTIEDMLPNDYTEEDVKIALTELGHPAKMANGYNEKPMHLIGPRFFDVYVGLLKLLIPIVLIISFSITTFVAIYSHSGEIEVINFLLSIIGEGIWGSLGAVMQTVFWITLTFAVAERVEKSTSTTPITANWKEWTPDDLKEVSYIPKERAISKIELFGSLIWTVIWVSLYFNANHFLGVFEKGANGLEMKVPLFVQSNLLTYWPLVVFVILIEIGLIAYKWKLGEWTKKLAAINAVIHFISLSIFILIFSNLSIFNPEFFTYFEERLGIITNLHWFTWGAIVIYIVSSASDIFQGYRKAKY
ncbi:hypothetical protein [Sutcliffiella rhizosphaerae]|uniref:Uncharacterized protein n=1 Tax=Sutcliffiella rhizosphaerae TaxID=2880967 RepID=A0ABM8YJZ4_9BACI|nr:hypothetical protein [Sutcliffiella rhizosphaerae]CAG9620243.1 hypothetical protein BACCIP111883_01011 [Sutcliffiella rhizosphaerae]